MALPDAGAMTGIPGQVQDIQSLVASQAGDVFDSMKLLADSSTEKALEADLSVDVSRLPLVPTYPEVELALADLDAALVYLDVLRALLDPAAPLLYPADYAETTYSSSLLTALNNLLYSDLINGGYGIDTDDEENLWNRARERELRGLASREDAATRQFGIAGFPMPTGAAQHAIQQIQQEASEKIATLGREIAIKRADLYVENRKHAITASTDLEKTKMSNFSAQMDRLLEHWKAGITKVTEEFRIRAQVYASIAGAYTSLFGANAGLAQAQASLAVGEITAKVAIYRAEMDKVFEKAKIELEAKKTAAQVYMALATAAMSAMNVNTSMGADANAGMNYTHSEDHNYEENA